MVPIVTDGVMCPPDMLAAQYTAGKIDGQSKHIWK